MTEQPHCFENSALSSGRASVEQILGIELPYGFHCSAHWESGPVKLIMDWLLLRLTYSPRVHQLCYFRTSLFVSTQLLYGARRCNESVGCKQKD